MILRCSRGLKSLQKQSLVLAPEGHSCKESGLPNQALAWRLTHQTGILVLTGAQMRSMGDSLLVFGMLVSFLSLQGAVLEFRHPSSCLANKKCRSLLPWRRAVSIMQTEFCLVLCQTLCDLHWHMTFRLASLQPAHRASQYTMRLI